MKNVMVFLLAMALAMVSMNSDARPRCGETERFGTQLVRVGDTERRVIEVAGEPDRERQLQTAQGGSAGFRMDYYLRGRTVQIYVRGGVVSRICRIRD